MKHTKCSISPQAEQQLALGMSEITSTTLSSVGLVYMFKVKEHAVSASKKIYSLVTKAVSTVYVNWCWKQFNWIQTISISCIRNMDGVFLRAYVNSIEAYIVKHINYKSKVAMARFYKAPT